MKNCIPTLIRCMFITMGKSRAKTELLFVMLEGKITGMIVTLLKRMIDGVKQYVSVWVNLNSSPERWNDDS